MTVKWLRKFDGYCLTFPRKDCYSSFTVELLLDRTKKEKHMDDLQYLHYQLQLEEQQYAELDSDGSVLPTVRPQLNDRNQTNEGEIK